MPGMKNNGRHMNTAIAEQDMTLRQAALVAGFAMLLMMFAPFAEFYVYPKLVVAGDIVQTLENITANRGLFVAGLIAYLIVFICDIVVAWALYLLFIPVHRALALLTAWFRVVYTVIAFVALFRLATVHRLIDVPEQELALGIGQLQSQVDLLLRSFRVEWGISLVLFGIHLLLLGWLAFRAAYVPTFIGVLLAIAGAGWVIYCLGPYLLPGVDLGLLMITFFGELVFMLWLLIRGWSLREPA